MSDRYKGGILSPTAPTVIPQSAGGVYTLSQQLQYQGQGVWPSAVNYPITKSLRFRSSASAYLNRTPASASNRKTFTISAWVKKGQLGVDSTILSAGYNTAPWFIFAYDGTNDTLDISATAGSSSSWKSAAYFRDPSAWYHVMCVVDTTSATATITNTATDRIRLYVNGVQQTLASGTVPTQNSDLQVNNTVAHSIGGYSGEYFDGYLAEVNFIDGQALTPSSFGTTDAYGIWQPIRYSGTYGTNGFYLPFTDTTSTSTLGTDFSGNSNTWTVNNISLTSGSTYDSMTDVPTNTNSNTANYCVLNPLDKGTNMTVLDANLQTTSSAAAWTTAVATIGITSGKWYWEYALTSGTDIICGIVTNQATRNNHVGGDAYGWGYYRTGQKVANNTFTSYAASYTSSDTIGVAFDADNGTLTFYKNNTSQGTAFTGLTGSTYFPANSHYQGATWINFGQRPFAYTAPTGFYPLNTYNLPTPTILAGNQYMDATTYTGNGSTLSVINAGSFQPDFVWIKRRDSGAESHKLNDSVRGVNKQLMSNSTDSEYTNTDQLTSFNSNGFTTGASGTTNGNGTSLVAWQWRASNAAGVSNTQGTITSTVSANTTAGFSVVTYTGTGVNATVGHGLGVAPSMVIIKNRTASGSWLTYHASIGNTGAVFLNLTNATITSSTYFNNTSPTSTVFSVGDATAGNGAGNSIVAYCFSAVAGYSAFGSYTSNNSTDGPFIYTGFRPRYVLIKAYSNAGESWNIFDSARGSYNVNTAVLFADSSSAEATNSSIDFLSNGFKLRSATGGVNYSSYSYIYMAFAENPFKIANAR